jgi:TRAP-type C4-dicarboxylate transport system permease small subunit
MAFAKQPGSRALALVQRIESVLDTVLALLLALVVASLIWQVFARYALGRAPGWTEEVARMTVAWMAMLGAAACLRRGEHIAVRVLLMAVPEGLRRILFLIRDALVLATAAVLGWAGARFALLNFDQESPALEIPMAIPYSAMAVGAVLLALMLMLVRLGGETPPVDAIGDESP